MLTPPTTLIWLILAVLLTYLVGLLLVTKVIGDLRERVSRMEARAKYIDLINIPAEASSLPPQVYDPMSPKYGK